MGELREIRGYGHVAKVFGLEEAIFLDSIVHWYRENRANNINFEDGRWWTYNSATAWADVFPWWTPKQIRRIITSCREQGAIVAGCYNKDKRDRSLWYSPTEKLLNLYLTREPSGCPNGKSTCPDRENELTQMVPPLPCGTHGDYNTPYNPPQGDAAGEAVEQEDKPKTRGKRSAYKPDWFDALWKIYPKKNARLAAQKKWDALKPDRETCRAILAGLERDKRSEQWQRDGGKYIPMLSTYLNQRRWEDQGVDFGQLPDPPDDKPRISWGDDREVT